MIMIQCYCKQKDYFMSYPTSHVSLSSSNAHFSSSLFQLKELLKQVQEVGATNRAQGLIAMVDHVQNAFAHNVDPEALKPLIGEVLKQVNVISATTKNQAVIPLTSIASAVCKSLLYVPQSQLVSPTPVFVPHHPPGARTLFNEAAALLNALDDSTISESLVRVERMKKEIDSISEGQDPETTQLLSRARGVLEEIRETAPLFQTLQAPIPVERQHPSFQLMYARNNQYNRAAFCKIYKIPEEQWGNKQRSSCSSTAAVFVKEAFRVGFNLDLDRILEEGHVINARHASLGGNHLEFADIAGDRALRDHLEDIDLYTTAPALLVAVPQLGGVDISRGEVAFEEMLNALEMFKEQNGLKQIGATLTNLGSSYGIACLQDHFIIFDSHGMHAKTGNTPAYAVVFNDVKDAAHFLATQVLPMDIDHDRDDINACGITLLKSR
jgi:hypothetical protein